GPRTGTDLDRLAIGTVTALAAIHRAGILHRDFKPSNVLMGPDGPRVIDFGIARALGSSSARGSGVMGTPSYMAPEQVSDGELGTGVDMFTWAATMLFAATGRHPFGNDTISAVFNHILHYEPDLSALPESLRGAVASCLAKDPAARPEAQEVLLNLLGGETTAEQGDEGTLITGADFARTPPAAGRVTTDSGGTSPAERQPTVPSPRRRRALGIAAAVAAPLLALTAAGTAWALLSDGSGKSPAAADALKSAAQAVETVLTLDHTSLDENREAARRVSTPRFRESYDKLLANRQYLEELKERKGSVRTEVADSAVVAASSGEVTVLSYARRTVRAEGADPARLRNPIRATMVRQGGRWLLDELYSLEADSPKAETAGAAWPGSRARAAMDAAARHPSVASGTPLETGLRPAGPGRLLALIVVGECEARCDRGDPVTVRRLMLRRSGDGWKVTTSERLWPSGALRGAVAAAWSEREGRLPGWKAPFGPAVRTRARPACGTRPSRRRPRRWRRGR